MSDESQWRCRSRRAAIAFFRRIHQVSASSELLSVSSFPAVVKDKHEREDEVKDDETVEDEDEEEDDTRHEEEAEHEAGTDDEYENVDENKDEDEDEAEVAYAC